MRLSKLLTLAVVATASAAAGQEGDGPSHPWSIGAGLGTNMGLTLSQLLSAVNFPNALPTASAPRATLSVERKLTRQLSLLAGFAGEISSNSTSPINLPVGVTSSTSLSSQTGALSVGLRYLIAGDLGVVAFTGHAAVNFGYGRIEAASSVSNGTTTNTTSTVSNGGALTLTAGVAAERLLTEQLALRVTLGLFEAGYAAGRGTSSGQPLWLSGFDIGIGLSPGLELRLYF